MNQASRRVMSGSLYQTVPAPEMHNGHITHYDRRLPCRGSQTTNTYPRLGGPMPVEAVIVLNLNRSCLFLRVGTLPPSNLGRISFPQCFSVSCWLVWADLSRYTQ